MNEMQQLIADNARRKKKSLRSEMGIALLSHGPAHYAAVEWFDKQDRLERKKRKGHNSVLGGEDANLNGNKPL